MKILFPYKLGVIFSNCVTFTFTLKFTFMTNIYIYIMSGKRRIMQYETFIIQPLNIDLHRTSQRTNFASPLDGTTGSVSWDNNRCSWRQSCFRQQFTLVADCSISCCISTWSTRTKCFFYRVPEYSNATAQEVCLCR